MSRFSLSIENGIKNAETARKNIGEIDSIFEELNADIKKRTSGLISFERASPGFFAEWANSSQAKSTQKKFGTLKLKNNIGNEAIIAKWEQAPDGYPFVVEFDGKRNDCWDEEGLVSILNDIVSTGYFWLAVKKLTPVEE